MTHSGLNMRAALLLAGLGGALAQLGNVKASPSFGRANMTFPAPARRDKHTGRVTTATENVVARLARGDQAELARRNWLMGFPVNGSILDREWTRQKPPLVEPGFRAGHVITAIRSESFEHRVTVARDEARDLLATAADRAANGAIALPTGVLRAHARKVHGTVQPRVAAAEAGMTEALGLAREAVAAARNATDATPEAEVADRAERLRSRAVDALERASDELVRAAGAMGEAVKLGESEDALSTRAFLAASRALGRAADVCALREGRAASADAWSGADQDYRMTLHRHRLDVEAEERRKRLDEEAAKRRHRSSEEVKKEEARLREEMLKRVRREEEAAMKRHARRDRHERALLKKRREREYEAAMKAMQEEDEKRRVAGADAIAGSTHAAYSDSWDACKNQICTMMLSDLSKSGCLYGCSGALEGAVEAGLEQVKRHDDCKVYCRGLLTQRAKIADLKSTKPALEHDAQWVGGCLDGCLGGLTRKGGEAKPDKGCSIGNLAPDRANVLCS